MTELAATIHFDKLPVRDFSGDKNQILSGGFTADELGEHLTKEWVAYVECHQCPRSDTCKYAEPHPNWSWKKKEIQCGLKSEVIKNFIRLTYPKLLVGDPKQNEHILSAAYYLAKFAFDAETQVGILIEQSWLNWFGGDHAPRRFAEIIHLRETLNKAAQDLSVVPSLYARKPILLVEGQSEKAFLERLRESNLSWFMDLRIEVYGGNGNRHPRRIQMRLEKYIEDGYVCYMQGDADGSQKDIFDKLLKQQVVKQENVFQFSHDFETSIPPNILLKALQQLGYLHEVDTATFERLIDCSKSSSKLIAEHFGIDIEPLKIDLADELGWLFCQWDFDWYNDQSKFMKETELGRFLDFVIKMR